MPIKQLIDELQILNEEVKRNNKKNRSLRSRIKIIETQISEYLIEKEQKGVKYRGKTILLKTKDKRSRKKKSDKEEDIVNLLRTLHIDNPKDVYRELKELEKGSVYQENKICIL